VANKLDTSLQQMIDRYVSEALSETGTQAAPPPAKRRLPPARINVSDRLAALRPDLARERCGPQRRAPSEFEEEPTDVFARDPMLASP
jgi:hypothetical protein